MNMGYALILGIRKKQKKYNICVKDFRYSLLVGSIQLIINELILVEKTSSISMPFVQKN